MHVIARTNSPTNEKHKFYNAMVCSISIGVVNCKTMDGPMCNHFVCMVDPVKTQK